MAFAAELPPLPLTGGCQCGALRYVISAPPLALWACHCHQCQRQSGSAFGLSMPVSAQAFRFTAGAPKIWQRCAASGRLVDQLFCEQCGNRIAHRHVDALDRLTLKPGTLDDTRWIIPTMHLFTASGQPWVRVLHRDSGYETLPPAFPGIQAAD